jgi:hypothetical protein
MLFVALFITLAVASVTPHHPQWVSGTWKKEEKKNKKKKTKKNI